MGLLVLGESVSSLLGPLETRQRLHTTWGTVCTLHTHPNLASVPTHPLVGVIGPFVL